MSDVLALCYHGVSEDWPADIAIAPSALERQVSWFLERGYRPTTFVDAVTGTGPRKALAVTFDDAYRSVHRLALPLLAALGVPATVFAPSAHVGEPGPRGWAGTDFWAATRWAGEIHVMGWTELEELVAAGWEIGSHSRSHPRLPLLGDGELREELAASRRELEDGLGRPCLSLAYPYGATDARVAAAAAAAGYRAAGGLLPDRLSPANPLLFPRLGVGRGWSDTTVHRRGRRGVRRLQGSPAWPALARALAARRGGALRRPPAAINDAAARLLGSGRWAARRAGSGWLVVPLGDRGVERWARQALRVAGPRRRGDDIAPDRDGLVHAALGAAGSPEPGPLRGACLLAARMPARCWVFRGGAVEPDTEVAVGLGDDAQGLRADCDGLALARATLATEDVLAALPEPPVWTGELDGAFATVGRPEPAPGAGEVPAALATDWLAAMHAAAAGESRPWDELDLEASLDLVRRGWALAPERREALADDTARMLGGLRGRAVPRGLEHGAFRPANVALDRYGRLRVHGWRHAATDRPPFLDIWSWQLDGIRERARADPAWAVEPLAAALARASAEVARRGMEPGFARATLPPSLAQIALRERVPGGGHHAEMLGLMAAVTHLLVAD